MMQRGDGAAPRRSPDGGGKLSRPLTATVRQPEAKAPAGQREPPEGGERDDEQLGCKIRSHVSVQ